MSSPVESTQPTLDALSNHIAVLGADGRIAAVNAAWRRFASTNGGSDPRELTGGSESASLVLETIIARAHDLNLTVVVEGVETGEQFQLLNSLNCGVLQGYLPHRALPASGAVVPLLGATPATSGSRNRGLEGSGTQFLVWAHCYATGYPAR